MQPDSPLDSTFGSRDSPRDRSVAWTALKIALGVALVAVIAAGAAVTIVRRSEAREEARARLIPFIEDEELGWMAEDASLLLRRQPMVSRAGPAVPAGPHPWSAMANEAFAGSRPMPEGARGLIATLTDDGQATLHEGTLELGDARMARSADEVAWIAFASELWVHELYAVDDEPVAVQRWDVQLFETNDGARVARGTIEASPALTGELRRGDLYVESDELAELVLQMLVLPARVSPPPPPPPSARERCLADRVTLPLQLDQEFDISCLDGANSECVTACSRGDGAACREAAYTLEHGSAEAARPYYELGCLARDATSCTLALGGEPRNSLEAACMTRVLDAACEAGDPAGCREWSFMAVGTPGADLPSIRSRLARQCAEHGVELCETLDILVGAGRLGEVEDAVVNDAYAAACANGWTEACATEAP